MLDIWGKTYHKAKYIENTEKQCNPDRGMYQMFTMILGETVDLTRFEKCLVPSESLVFLMVDISLYKDSDLPDEELQRIRETIGFFTSHEKDVILRVVYDHQGEALKHEPSLFRQVKVHMEQVAGMLRECASQVFVYQGLLIGNWGEMHTSKFIGKSKMRELLEIMDMQLGGEMYMAVRRPCFYRQIREELPARQALEKCKVGLYDDAILGSESDMGTFGDARAEGIVWENAWRRELELDFLEELCSVAPCGGEGVLGDRFIYSLSAKDILAIFGKMHLTYLNRLYDTNLLDYLKKMKYTGEGPFRGHSLYEYIEAHLGYRFLVTDSELAVEEGNGVSRLKMKVCVANTGFANMYRDGQVFLSAKCDGSEREVTYCLGSLSRVRAGEIGEYLYVLGASSDKKSRVDFYLSAKRSFDNRRIYFGNNSENDGKMHLGYLTGYKIDEVVS